jgi:hypothetical protein
MKNILKTISFLFIGALIFTSCDDEDYTGASQLTHTDATITVTAVQSSYAFNENLIDEDAPETYSFAISASITKTENVDITVRFNQKSGNADTSDYSVGDIVIRAGDTSASTMVEVLYTGDIEATETFTLSASTEGNSTLSGPFEIPVTITDKVNDVLEFSTTWEGSFTDADDTLITADFCAIDMDVLLFTAAGSFVQYLGATGSCTETGSISSLADGDYFLVINLYANPLSGMGLTETVPVTISYSQDSFSSGSFVYNDFNLGSVGGDSVLEAVATITVEGYNYTVTPL